MPLAIRFLKLHRVVTSQKPHGSSSPFIESWDPSDFRTDQENVIKQKQTPNKAGIFGMKTCFSQNKGFYNFDIFGVHIF